MSVTVETSREDGMPDNQEGERLATVEERLQSVVDGRAMLVAVVTVARRRDYWLYASDKDWMSDGAHALRAANPDRQIEVHVGDDPSWDLYRQLRDDGLIANADRITLDRLVEQGADLQAPREIRYFLRFPDEERATSAAQVLRDHEYIVTLTPPRARSGWQVVASHEERATARILAHMRGMLGRFADDRGGILDGWEAAV